jgi:hypothetical protein
MAICFLFFVLAFVSWTEKTFSVYKTSPSDWLIGTLTLLNGMKCSLILELQTKANQDL